MPKAIYLPGRQKELGERQGACEAAVELSFQYQAAPELRLPLGTVDFTSSLVGAVLRSLLCEGALLKAGKSTNMEWPVLPPH